jgi:hypothetical protein
MNFTDSANNRIGYLCYDLVSGETSESIIIRVIPSAGTRLLSEQSDSVSLKAREHGSGDPFVDLADGIDLSGYTPGVAVDFDLICEASEALTGLVRVALFLGVVNSGGAAWAE